MTPFLSSILCIFLFKLPNIGGIRFISGNGAGLWWNELYMILEKLYFTSFYGAQAWPFVFLCRITLLYKRILCQDIKQKCSMFRLQLYQKDKRFLPIIFRARKPSLKNAVNFLSSKVQQKQPSLTFIDQCNWWWWWILPSYLIFHIM